MDINRRITELEEHVNNLYLMTLLQGLAIIVLVAALILEAAA